MSLSYRKGNKNFLICNLFKDFKFVGWHPHCRCIATTILKTEEEMQADTERILNGEEPLPASSSKNYIGGLPDKFTEWVEKNETRIANAKSLPYFLKDNEKLINGTNATANSDGGGSNGGGENTLATGGGGGGKPPVNNGGGGGDGGGFGDGGDDGNNNGGGYNGGNVQLDDDEIRRRVHKAFADIGETIDDKDIKIEDGYVRLTAEQAAKLSKGQSITKSEDGQIHGYYIGHNESWDLNDSMRFDANGKYDPIPNTTSLENVSNRLKPISKSMIETTKALDSVISKNSLNFPVRVIRMVAIEMVENMVGMRSKPYSSPYSRDVSGAYNKLQQLGKFTMREGGYMSVSFDPSANVMKGRAAMLVIDLPTGTNIYVTDNKSESEGILGRGRQLLSNRIEIGKIQNGKSTNDVLRIYCRPR